MMQDILKQVWKAVGKILILLLLALIALPLGSLLAGATPGQASSYESLYAPMMYNQASILDKNADGNSGKKKPTRTPVPTATTTPRPTIAPTSAPTATAMPSPTATASAGGPSIMWGAYNQGVPFDMAKLAAFETTAGKKVSIVHWGQPWMMNGEYQNFQTAEFDKVRAYGAIPMLNWGSWHLGFGPEQPDFKLSTIYQGQHDAYLRQWAAAAKSWGYPLFLRFNHEMNGWWYPWSEQVNGNQPGDYVRAWVHVHNIFRDVGATNITWVWAINEIGPRSTPASSLYPGHQYVDWVAIDAYNRQSSTTSSWRSFSTVMKPTYDELGVIAPNKPVMIAEFASAEHIGTPDPAKTKALWIQDALEVQIPSYFPRIKAIVWFNWNDNDPAKTWPIGSSPEAAAAFRRGISLGVYATNTFGNISGWPIQPLR